MGRNYPETSLRAIDGCFVRLKTPLSAARALFALRAKLPTGKLALVVFLLSSFSPEVFADKARIAPPGEPTLKVQKIDRSSVKPLRTRGKKKRKYKRRKKPKKQVIKPDQTKAAKKEQQQKALAPTKVHFIWSLALSYNTVETTGDRHRNSTVEPSVHMAWDLALKGIPTTESGGAVLLGLKLANVNGATVYDDVFFRYSYNYIGPSLSFRYFNVSERPADDPRDAQTALRWSFGVKGAVVMVQPNQQGQGNATPEELEFGGSRSLQFDSPGLLGEVGGSYHLNNHLAVDIAAGKLLATERTYTFVSFGVSGTL